MTYAAKMAKSILSLMSRSTEYISLENLDRILPVGVVSKKDIGARKIETRSPLWSSSDARTPKRARNMERKKTKTPDVKHDRV